jgi:BASS family bile acid:Na+ symporter
VNPPDSAPATVVQQLRRRAQQITTWIHAWFILILIAVDVLAAAWPTPGQSLRQPLGQLPFFGLEVRWPNILLAGMLFIAGMSLRPEHWHQVGRRPVLLILGTLGCWLLPMFSLLCIIKPLMSVLSMPELPDIWLGLVIVAAMPTAQSSAAWTQNAKGNVLLTLSIVLTTTIVCPVVIPNFVRALSTNLPDMTWNWDEVFSSRVLLTWVILPSALGWSFGAYLGRIRLDFWSPFLSLLSAIMLLTLNYINAADALPKLLQTMELKLVMVTLSLVLIVCGGSYLISSYAGRWAKLPAAEKTAMTYALGMKNNGVALMGTASLPELPFVGLVLICYILTQHLLAGLVSHKNLRRLQQSETLLAND